MKQNNKYINNYLNIKLMEMLVKNGLIFLINKYQIKTIKIL